MGHPFGFTADANTLLPRQTHYAALRALEFSSLNLQFSNKSQFLNLKIKELKID